MENQNLVRKGSSGYGSISKSPKVSKSPKARWADRKRSSSNVGSQDKGLPAESEEHKTTAWQSAFHLVKGYIGCGILSLPWAISQMGLPFGVFAVFLLSAWTSYNCWTVVRVKRFVDQTPPPPIQENNNNNNNNEDPENDTQSRTSASSNNTTTTYPDVGGWAYGETFHKLVTATIFMQQMAVCTVFVSFVGTNIWAVLKRLHITTGFVGWLSTHAGSLTLALPFILSLSFLPNLRALAPVTKTGAVFLFVGFAAVFMVVGMEWRQRPQDINFAIPLNIAEDDGDDDDDTNPYKQIPLAMCAILYSYEGICLILPVESAMQEPEQYKTVFIGSMFFVAAVMALFGALTVICFGNVTNGSITAFLLAEYNHEDSETENLTLYIMLANAAVSLSILMTYPLHMFPALELLAAWIYKKFHGGDFEDLMDDEELLDAFEPLPALPEHDILEHDHDHDVVISMDQDAEDGDNGRDNDKGNDEDDDDDDEKSVKSIISMVTSALPDMEMTIPGDSIYLRTGVVVFTYLVSVLVPSVESLVSLAGALAGSTNALLLPPLLDLALIRHLESQDLKEGEKISWWGPSQIRCYVLFFFGMVFAIIGTYSSFMDIVHAYSK